MNTMYNEGVRVESAPACYLCETNGLPLFQELRDALFGAPGTWRLLRCPACGLGWLDPRPVREDVPKLYVRYYTHAESDAPRDATAQFRTILKHGILAAAFGYRDAARSPMIRAVGRLLSWIPPVRDVAGGAVMWQHRSPHRRLLDVGCGGGQFLVLMRHLGWEVAGIDPDPAAVQVARERFGLEVTVGTLEQYRFADESFDVITMNHVIEHVLDPIGVLSECRRILRPGGRLIVATPNIQSLGCALFGKSWRGLEPPRHIVLFSRQTIATCARRAGLQVRRALTTARGARFIWHASSLLKRDGAIPGGNPRHTPLGAHLGGILFWAAEDILTRIRPFGEEVILHAARP
jgi:SAM-dependent methyltransferase